MTNLTNKKQCILIIDDSPVQLAVLGHILAPSYDVMLAKNGELGLKLAEENNIDLILLDLIMEGMSGFEVLVKFKESAKTRAIPVIFVTGSDNIEDEQKGLQLGAVDYIRKPFIEEIVILRVGLQLKLINQMKTIENFSLTDSLTGICNRHSFNKTIQEMWLTAAERHEPLSMLVLDIDKFKNFNDKHGHLNGDICLKTVAQAIQSYVDGGKGHAFRWGGEEFVILLPATEIDKALTIAEEVREKIAATPIQLREETCFVTGSIGAGSIKPTANLSFDDGFNKFYTNIDEALYQAKENGRNRVEQAQVL
ncbi:MAG: diguanylate cyclase [Spirochaetaceae bacterium]|nr:diguanylate cyclase [Spirochaetaceae bacterium]